MVAPTVTAISPNSGLTLGGDVVNVTGTGFLVSAPAVAFGAFAASEVVVSSDTFLTCVSPPALNGSGAINVVVTTTAGSSATGGGNVFTYSYPAGNGINYLSVNPFMDLFANYTLYGQWNFAMPPSFSGGAGSFATLAVSGLSSLAGVVASGAVQINNTLGVTGASTFGSVTAVGAHSISGSSTAITSTTVNIGTAVSTAVNIGRSGAVTLIAGIGATVAGAGAVMTDRPNAAYKFVVADTTGQLFLWTPA